MSLLKDKIELGIQEAEFETQKALSRFPPMLRWLIILIVIGLIPAYYITKNISLKIWLGRYKQGLIAAKPSFTNPIAPTASDVSLTTMGPGVYSAVVEVVNENLDLSADRVPYVFNFYNAQKQLLFSAKDKLFLLPDQKKYVAVSRFSTPEPVAFTEFQIPGPVAWQKRLQIPEVSFKNSAPNAYHQFSPPAFVLEGDFTNRSAYTLKQVRLIFVLFDKDKKIIGVSQRDEFTVKPLERRAYKQLWPGVFAPNLYNVEVRAYTDTLDQNNLMLQTPSSGSSSDLSRPKNPNSNNPF